MATDHIEKINRLAEFLDADHDKDCKHGHRDCSTRKGGRCTDETLSEARELLKDELGFLSARASTVHKLACAASLDEETEDAVGYARDRLRDAERAIGATA